MEDIDLRARVLGKPQVPHGRTNHAASAAARAYNAWQPAAHSFIQRQFDDGGAGDFEVIPVAPGNTTWLDELRTELATASAGKQVAIGGISGWVSGYVVGKAGKAVALALGGSLIILQIANYQGLIQINWTRVQTSYNSTRRRIGQHVADNMSTFVDNMREFARQHAFLAGSFGAGFLLGLIT